jgi:hypothetical protein
MLAATSEPLSLTKSLNDSNWKNDMDVEFDALVRNRT